MISGNPDLSALYLTAPDRALAIVDAAIARAGTVQGAARDLRVHWRTLHRWLARRKRARISTT